MSRFLAAGLLAALMALARWFNLGDLTSLEHQATVSLGFILIIGYLVGHLVIPLRLPRITGYILAGILCGPFVSGFLTGPVVAKLQLIDDLALTLIAFTAGGELKVGALRSRARSILGITLLQTLIVFSGLAALAWVLLPRVDFLTGLTRVQLVGASLVVGLIGVANSPATVVALINEYRSKGVFTQTVLGVTVVKDVLVLVLITVLLPLIWVLSSPGESVDPGFVRELAWTVGGSLIGGVLVGLLVTGYMRGIGAVLPLFIVGASLLISQFARAFHLEALLLCMVAGFVVENATRYGERFIHAIERSSLPVYVVFFAIGGASLDLGALRTAWLVTVILALTRIALTWGATAWGETISRGGSDTVRRLGWTGFVAQAGVTLGIASIVARTFPDWGPAIRTIALALIAFNQLLGPVAFRYALLKSGEGGLGTRL